MSGFFPSDSFAWKLKQSIILETVDILKPLSPRDGIFFTHVSNGANVKNKHMLSGKKFIHIGFFPTLLIYEISANRTHHIFWTNEMTWNNEQQ